ncbi:calcium-dependent protein kinase CDPK9 [Cyclospora cayetanensis]|uniref:Calcium-dependent protein kinase CDPK9 n=1 Tax=Cyclospora cayetanensis TaxID=88456 RepID=A0A1D3D5Q3_9EIME|nr:calcium-dependent protein kinase CDPK9 [Cyclospora cayetanensis]
MSSFDKGKLHIADPFEEDNDQMIRRLIDEAFNGISHGKNHVNLMQAGTGLEFVFKRLQPVVPLPDRDWYSAVFRNYDVDKDGEIDREAFEDIVRQLTGYHPKVPQSISRNFSKSLNFVRGGDIRSLGDARVVRKESASPNCVASAASLVATQRRQLCQCREGQQPVPKFNAGMRSSSASESPTAAPRGCSRCSCRCGSLHVQPATIDAPSRCSAAVSSRGSLICKTGATAFISLQLVRSKTVDLHPPHAMEHVQHQHLWQGALRWQSLAGGMHTMQTLHDERNSRCGAPAAQRTARESAAEGGLGNATVSVHPSCIGSRGQSSGRWDGLQRDTVDVVSFQPQLFLTLPCPEASPATLCSPRRTFFPKVSRKWVTDPLTGAAGDAVAAAADGDVVDDERCFSESSEDSVFLPHPARHTPLDASNDPTSPHARNSQQDNLTTRATSKLIEPEWTASWVAGDSTGSRLSDVAPAPSSTSGRAKRDTLSHRAQKSLHAFAATIRGGVDKTVHSIGEKVGIGSHAETHQKAPPSNRSRYHAASQVKASVEQEDLNKAAAGSNIQHLSLIAFPVIKPPPSEEDCSIVSEKACSTGQDKPKQEPIPAENEKKPVEEETSFCSWLLCCGCPLQTDASTASDPSKLSVTAAGGSLSDQSVQLASHIMYPAHHGVCQVFRDYRFAIQSPEQWELIKSEVELLKALNHPNIMKLFETYQDGYTIYLIIELCKGGPLFDRIVKHYDVMRSPITEEQMCGWMRQILSACSYCHERGVVHRDLKPENILFVDASDDSPLKVIDFGLSGTVNRLRETAKEVKERRSGVTAAFAKLFPIIGGKHIIPWYVRRVRMQRAGTPHYMAPEMIRGQYDEKCDLFSVGIIMFQAKDLLKKLMQKNPRKRISAQAALEHPWFTLLATRSTCASQLTPSVFEGLRSWQRQNRLKQAVLQLLAKELNETDIIQLRKKFEALDRTGKGTITVDELKQSMREAGYTVVESELEQIFNSIDANQQGHIGYNEFISTLLARRIVVREEQLREIFDKFDSKGEGRLTLETLRDVLKRSKYGVLTDGELQMIFAEIDKNSDGYVDFYEFCDLMTAAD